MRYGLLHRIRQILVGDLPRTVKVQQDCQRLGNIAARLVAGATRLRDSIP